MRNHARGQCIPAKHYYSQKILLERLQDYCGDELLNPLLLARLHRNVTVDGRYLAIPAEQYLDIKTCGRQRHPDWASRPRVWGAGRLCVSPHNAGLEARRSGSSVVHDSHRNPASPSIDAC